METLKLISGYLKKNDVVVPPSLIKEIASKYKSQDPYLCYEQVINTLRFDYGYKIVGEQTADDTSNFPYKKKLSQPRNLT